MTSNLTAFLMSEINRLREEDPDNIVDEFNITSDELITAFSSKIYKQLKEIHYGDEEDYDEG